WVIRSRCRPRASGPATSRSSSRTTAVCASRSPAWPRPAPISWPRSPHRAEARGWSRYFGAATLPASRSLRSARCPSAAERAVASKRRRDDRSDGGAEALDRLFERLASAPAGLHDLAPPSAQLPAGLPDALIELYARCDGGRLYVDSVELA